MIVYIVGGNCANFVILKFGSYTVNILSTVFPYFSTILFFLKSLVLKSRFLVFPRNYKHPVDKWLLTKKVRFGWSKNCCICVENKSKTVEKRVYNVEK